MMDKVHLSPSSLTMLDMRFSLWHKHYHVESVLSMAVTKSPSLVYNTVYVVESQSISDDNDSVLAIKTFVVP
jgi:hypothetical protein